MGDDLTHKRVFDLHAFKPKRSGAVRSKGISMKANRFVVGVESRQMMNRGFREQQSTCNVAKALI